MHKAAWILCSALVVLGACGDDNGQATADQGVDAADAASDAGDTGLPDAAPNKVVTCDNPPLNPPATGTCSGVKGTGVGLLLSGTVLAPDTIYENGRVLVVGSSITCVGCDCSTEPESADASRIECAKGVITPGLINPHDHLGFTETPPAIYEAIYDHRHEWREGISGKPKIRQMYNAASQNKRGVSWGELRQLLAGTTSIIGAGGTAWGLLRNLDFEDTEGLSGMATSDTFPLDDSDGIMKAQQCDYPSLPDEQEIQVDLAYVTHVAEGIGDESHNEFLCLSSQHPDAVDILLPSTTLVHAMALTLSDARRIGQAGTGVSWTPRGNISLYGMTADVVMLKRAGVKLSLGTDWTITGSMNLLRELACASQLNDTYLDGAFSSRELWMMVTASAADAIGFGGQLGRIEAGYVADLAVFDGVQHQHYEAITAGSVREVALVLRGGELLYGDDSVMATLGDPACEPIDICGQARRVCVKPEIGITLDQLEQEIVDARTTKEMQPVEPYALFFCGNPVDEPSCVPSRPGEFDGVSTPQDTDGDGVDNSADTCPTIFNPPRPMNDGQQPDSDGDGHGDECDPCPLDADTTDCESPVAPTDRDGDGVEDGTDTCPDLPNGPDDPVGQVDTDGDGLGDACDPCPQHKGLPCPSLVKELRDPSLGKQPATDEVVLVEGGVVIGVRITKPNNYGFYVRQGTAPFEAIFVFTKDEVPADDAGVGLKLGDQVDVVGRFGSFSNTTQIEQPSSIVIVGSGDITPVGTTTKSLQPGSVAAEGLESQLVQVQGVTVRGMVDAAINDFFWISDDGDPCSGAAPPCAQVGDFFYDGGVKDGQPSVVTGDLLSSVVGIVNSYKDNHTLDVRGDGDLVK